MVFAKGVTAWIEIKRPDATWVRSDEYKTKVEEAKVSTYIESFQGTQFRVHYTGALLHPIDAHNGDCDLTGEVILDGVSVCSRVLYRREPGRTAVVSGQTISYQEEVPFAFAKLRTTDQDEIATKDEHVVKGAGSIVIQVHPVIIRGSKIATTFSKPKEHILHERTKKAILSHSTSFGQPVPRTASFVDATYLDPGRQPAVSFEFLYRSGDLLEAQGIMPPRNPPDDPVEIPAVVGVALPAGRSSIRVTDSPGVSTSRSTSGATAVAGDSGAQNGTRKAGSSIKVKREKLGEGVKVKAEGQGTQRGPIRTIEIDDSDDETELSRLKAENARLRKKVKLEGSGGGIVDLTVDSD